MRSGITRILIFAGLLQIALVPALCSEGTTTTGPFSPTWDSLKTHRDPEWFRDAKLGIYTHWGPVTVGCEDCPKGGQWYGGEIYNPRNPVFAFHKQHFGDQTKVGYKDVIPLFKAEKFDAEAWADLFAQAGAKFAGPVAAHHDNFAMWNSAVTPWNSVKMGPRRDITGELEKALRKRGLRFITSFHHGYAWRYYQDAFTYDAADPKYAQLYTEPHKKDDPPSKRFLDQWLAMVNEVVVKYQPDMTWFDFDLNAVITPEYQRRMFADYYNWAEQHQRGSAVAHKHRNIHQYTGILDFERGREDKLVPYPWLTDTSVGPWFHNKKFPFRSADNLVDVLVDIVSKNGCMLLNVGPAADGSIPDEARRLLLELGEWLKVNGEAIYGTRPWTAFGEGPTQKNEKGGAFSESSDKPFTAEDVRFTTKGDALYAIALAWPADGILKIRSLAEGKGPARISSVRLLGHEGELAFKRDDACLSVSLPEKQPCKHAFALKIAKSAADAAARKETQKDKSAQDPLLPVTGYQRKTIEGWTVVVSDALLRNENEATSRALDLLQKQLAEIVRVVPAPAVARLRTVPLWFSPAYPGARPKAEYHPAVDWLRSHGRNPAMAKAIEFTNVRIFAEETRRMPVFVLHELAHSYHDQVLGFDNPEIKAAYRRAVESKSYDAVERSFGNPAKKNTTERAYAMTDAKEYFAETTEAFFGRNDFFPFNRVELEKHDPKMYRLLQCLWQCDDAGDSSVESAGRP